MGMAAKGLQRDAAITARSAGGAPHLAIFMLPVLATLVLTQLAFWPAQMSPDSISQWQQLLAHNGGSDASPALSYVLNLVPFLILPHPAFVVAVQYTLFAWASAVLLRETTLAGVPTWAAIVAAILFAIFPPNFLIATTLWKDVPYTTGILLLTAGVWRLMRSDFRLPRLLAAWLTLAGTLVLGTRHNGLFVVIPLFFLLAMVAPRGHKMQMATLGAVQMVLFVLSKSLLLWCLSMTPAPSEYRTIFALPLIGAMISQGQEVELSLDDLSTISQVMPLSSWRDAYRCDSVVPLFWNARIDRSVLVSKEGSINRIALQWAAHHPIPFIMHQLCMTRILWSPLPSAGEWIPMTTYEITPIPEAAQMGLKTAPKLPDLRGWIRNYDVYLGRSEIYNRPATYVWLGFVAAIVLGLMLRQQMLLVFVPAALNVFGLVPIIGSQDYRYVWPSQAVCFVLICTALLMGVSLAIARLARADIFRST